MHIRWCVAENLKDVIVQYHHGELYSCLDLVKRDVKRPKRSGLVIEKPSIATVLFPTASNRPRMLIHINIGDVGLWDFNSVKSLKDHFKRILIHGGQMRIKNHIRRYRLDMAGFKLNRRPGRAVRRFGLGRS